jgi:hypothetical protein
VSGLLALFGLGHPPVPTCQLADPSQHWVVPDAAVESRDRGTRKKYFTQVTTPSV